MRRLADQLTAAAGTLSITTTMLMLPLAVLVVWAVFLRPSGFAAAQFGREPAAAEPINLEGDFKEERFVAFSATASESHPSARAWPVGYAGLVLIGLGVLMLLFTALSGQRSRSAYLTSTPAARASVSATPSVIRVRFSGALHSTSTLSLVYVPVVPGIDDISRDISAASRISSADPERRTLEVIPPRLATGVYLVRWVANPERGGVIVHGSFAFGVGVAVPEDTGGVTYSLDERDSGARAHRLTIFGGTILLAMGALAWYRASFVQ